MKIKKIYPPVSPFLQVRLEQVYIDFLWKIIKKADNSNINQKDQLVGNISKSLMLDDLNSFFYKSVCIPLIKYYREIHPKRVDPVSQNSLLGPNSQLILNKFWVNYQYKTEFNPYHDHTGVYSFAIWMKIPYSHDDQKLLPQFTDIKEGDIKAGNFEFEYIDTLGSVTNYSYKLSQQFENIMVFFPAGLRHCVYPFYETDEPRISVAGNLSYLPV